MIMVTIIVFCLFGIEKPKQQALSIANGLGVMRVILIMQLFDTSLLYLREKVL